MNRLALIFIALFFAGCMPHIPSMQQSYDNISVYVVENTKAADYTFVEKNTPLTHWVIDGVDAYCNEKYASPSGYGCFSGGQDTLTKGMNPRTFEWEPLSNIIKITKERPHKAEAGTPLPGEIAKGGIGDIFFTLTTIDPLQRSENFKYDMTITSLNEKDIALQYAEYFMNDSGVWLIKQGFNKTFTYSPKETIRFKGYEFEPLSVSSGQITYKRTK